MNEILQPRTDAGVLAQVIVVVVILVVALFRVRGHRDATLLVLALGMFTFGLFMLRASH